MFPESIKNWAMLKSRQKNGLHTIHWSAFNAAFLGFTELGNLAVAEANVHDKKYKAPPPSNNAGNPDVFLELTNDFFPKNPLNVTFVYIIFGYTIPLPTIPEFAGVIMFMLLKLPWFGAKNNPHVQSISEFQTQTNQLR